MAEIGESMSLVFVVEETAYRPRAVALYTGIVVHPGLSLAQEHAPGAFGIDNDNPNVNDDDNENEKRQ